MNKKRYKVVLSIICCFILYLCVGCSLNKEFDDSKIDFSCDKIVNNKDNRSVVIDNACYFISDNSMYKVKEGTRYYLGYGRDNLKSNKNKIYYLAEVEDYNDENDTLCLFDEGKENVLVPNVLDYKILDDEIYYLTLDESLYKYNNKVKINLKLDNLSNLFKKNNNLIYAKKNLLLSYNLNSKRSKVLCDLPYKIQDVNITGDNAYISCVMKNHIFVYKYDLSADTYKKYKDIYVKEEYVKTYYTRDNSFYILTMDSKYYYLYDNTGKKVVNKIGDKYGTEYTDCHILIINNKNYIINYDNNYLLIFDNKGKMIQKLRSDKVA